MKKLKLIILIILLLIITCNISFAQDEMQIICDKSVIEKGEEFNLSIDIKNIEIAALTLEIYWDNSNLEYISGPENSNNVNNKILYTWVSENGQNSNEITIEAFKFRAVNDGTASISASGEFYNSNGEEIKIENSNIEIKIGEEINQIEEINNDIEVSYDSTDLGILRLNQEGISPDFNKDIKEYYFIADKSIESIDITAIPQNPAANVIITGNNNLKFGENVIDIKVESQDNSKSSIYKIYVTKTQNLETANANLETLAVRQATLAPEFDSNMTQYRIEIGNDVDKIDILAIPQKENAKVDILGNGEMKVGDNKIEINVIAENGTTHKKYEILVHRRNDQEELKNKEEKQIQAQRLSNILEQKQNEDEENEINIKQKNGKLAIIITLAGIFIIVNAIIIYKHKIKKRNVDNNKFN